ncbi:MAG TPA: hypothetical protein PL033_02270 [Candidatus Brocadiia bacterium]|nr:hypothetical protein [Candidatus Brocadiia bacterium]
MVTLIPKGHVWRFFRAGGLDQVNLDSALDLANLDKLDPKLWVALSCPVKGLEYDVKTLELIDTDKDGRVRIPEILEAVKWACGQLKNPGELTKCADGLPLASINDQTDLGKATLISAKRILINLGKPDATSITVAEATDTAKIFAQTLFNADGIIPASACPDADAAKIIGEIIVCMGGEMDRSGQPGVNQAKVDAFFAALKDYSDWKQIGEAISPAGEGVLPLGDATAGAFAALQVVRPKLDDYFARCRLAAFDQRATGPLNLPDSEYAALAAKDLSKSAGDMGGLPIQKIEPKRPFNMVEGVNPAWVKQVEAFRNAVVTPLLGADKATLSESDWGSVQAKLAAYEGWMGSKKGAAVESLGVARVREIMAGNVKSVIEDLIRQDMALAAEVSGMGHVERLARYCRDLYNLLTNFINFADFYDMRGSAIFQTGTLYLDQRSYDLCVRIDDPNAHSAIATLSKIYLIYCVCVRKGLDKINIVAAVTQGDPDYLMVGRNGVFYDRQGRDWDATIVKIIDNPISVRQAFLSPYKKFMKLIEAQIEKFAATKDKAIQDKAAAAAATEPSAVISAGKTPLKKDPFDIARFAGIFAAIGLALGAIGGAFGAIMTAFVKMGWFHAALVLGGIVIVISGPSMIIAWLKLRQRTLGPILEGTGWAINGRIKINIPLGARLTAVKKLPPNARRSLKDPFEDVKARRRNRIIAMILGLILGTAIGWWWTFIRPRATAATPPPAEAAATAPAPAAAPPAPAKP